MTYEGYTNINTFDVVSTFDNVEELYAAYQRRIAKRGPFDARRASLFVREHYPYKTPSGYGLSRVNWQEVAEAFNPESAEDAANLKEWIEKRDKEKLLSLWQTK